MTNVIEEVQLDYCDVMIKPKRSTLNSRNEPDVYRTYKMKHTDKTLYGNGLMIANMVHQKSLGQIYCLDENFLEKAKEKIGEYKLKKLFK